MVSVVLTACTATSDATTESASDPVNLTPTPTQTQPTPIPTPTPMPEPQMSGPGQRSEYRGDIDVRDLYKNIDKYIDWKLTYAGHVLNLEGISAGTWLQLTVQYGATAYETEIIDFVFPTSVSMDGIYENTYVTVWGRPYEMTTITNMYGGPVDQPLFVGDYISK
jgi:hypothetical protein